MDSTGRPLRRQEYLQEEATCLCGEVFQRRAIGEPKLYCSKRCRSRYGKREQRANGYTRPPQPPCTIEGCDKEQKARGWCAMHYERAKKYGDPGEAASRHNPGEWRLAKDGYIYRCIDAGRQLQHRVVMEEMLARPLYPEENVHHRNGRRDDNRPENLELWVKAQPAGQRVDEMVAWVVEHYPQQVRQALAEQETHAPKQ